MDKQKFKERLKECLMERGMSQTELARKIGVSPSQVSRYISGKAFPSTNAFLAMMEVLKFDPDYLLGRTDKKSYFFALKT